MLEARAQQLGVDGSMIFHNRFVSQDGADGVPVGRGHLHHAVPQSGADHVGHAGLRRRRRQGGHLHAVHLRARAAGRRARRARALAGFGAPSRAKSSTWSATARALQAMCARAAAHGRAMTWPAVARPLRRELRARAGRARRAGAAARSRRRRWPARPAGLARDRPRGTCSTMTDDTGILQHAVFSIPRYEDGYCLDDNARALLLMTLARRGRHRRSGGRPRAGLALSGVRELRVRSIDRPLPELSVVRAAVARAARIGGQPRPRAVGARRRRRAGRAIPAGTASPASCFTPRCRR